MRSSQNLKIVAITVAITICGLLWSCQQTSQELQTLKLIDFTELMQSENWTLKPVWILKYKFIFVAVVIGNEGLRAPQISNKR